MPSVQLYGGSKAESIEWLRGKQQTIEDANSVLIVGGGALGIQFATDIATVYPGKPVTLLHSRTRLLARFDSEMDTEILQAMESANINVILSERLDLGSSTSGHSTVRTTTGRIIHADLVVRLLPLPLSSSNLTQIYLLYPAPLHWPTPQHGTPLIARIAHSQHKHCHCTSPAHDAARPRPPPSPVTPALLPACASDNEEHVLAAALAQIALQNESVSSAVSDEEGVEGEEEEEEEEEELTTPYPHIFAIGDAANAFGAIPAGHNAYYQAEVAARNVLRLVHGKTDEQH
ncbi:hypothetical protein R3P38DRAFT_3605595 [Favolaschia claudopus]|uniref:FAD/NAD(P)-binding domain-containing protein n=1 Tax=Favolaschia claudopus TaxID=2862362 RepID=A0AAW0A9B6_9AGAR